MFGVWRSMGLRSAGRHTRLPQMFGRDLPVSRMANGEHGARRRPDDLLRHASEERVRQRPRPCVPITISSNSCSTA